MTYPLQKIILFEVDKPIELENMINAEPGIWHWTIVNTVETVDDDRGNTGYYEYQQDTVININSVRVSNEPYTKTNSFGDLRATNKSFYYVNNKLYIHFEDFEPPLDKQIFYGESFGYSKLPSNTVKPYYGGAYYEPLLSEIPNIKKSIDPLFFGLLKYVKASVTLINSNGEFDDWRDRDLFGQPARLLVGDIGDDYVDFQKVFEGFVSDDSRGVDKFKIKIEDARKALTQPVASNKLRIEDWPDISEGNINEVKPVAYGQIFNAECICLNEEDTSAADRIFLICDTEFNSVQSLDKIYVDGVETAITGAADLADGTFTMTKVSVFDNFGEISADFVSSTFETGINIILNLMLNYDNKPFIDSLWDTTEVNAAVSRDSSLYIDKGNTKLSKAIEEVCVDIDARFFMKNGGLYTIRIYDEDRTPNTREIENIEWMGNPSIDNNGSQFLSSVIISYAKDQKEDKYLTYENDDYKDDVFDRYKKLKVGQYNTMLPTLSDAMDKSETIMNISKNVQDVVERDANWNNYGIEASDFIIGSPETRQSEASERNIYEVLKINNNLKKFNVGLSLRYIKAADPLAVYATIDDNNDLNINDNDDLNLIGRVS